VSSKTPKLTIPLVAVVTLGLVATLFVPVAMAQNPLGFAGSAAATATAQARSVGTFKVLPVEGAAGAGEARGSIVTTTVAEAGTGLSGVGILNDFSLASHAKGAATLFNSVDIAGFVPVAKLQGAGTSSLTLEGEAAIVSITDNVNGLLSIRATGDLAQRVTLTTPSSVVVTEKAEGVLEITSKAEGGVSGVLLLLSATGKAQAAAGSSLSLDSANKIRATLEQNSQLVFRANTDYAASADAKAKAAVESYNAAVVEALASGKLAGEAATEFTSGADLLANVNYFSTVTTKTEATAANRVVSQVRATAEAEAEAKGHVMAYDLDYVDVPAKSADQVAVYVDGALAQRVESAAEVNQAAELGQAAYYATTLQGRVLVLASTETTAKASTITVASVPDASLMARTLAQLDATLGVTSQIQGGFDLYGTLLAETEGKGEVVGTFSSFFASEAKGEAGLVGFTDVRSATEIFSSITFAGEAATEATADVKAQAEAAASAASSVQMDTSVAGNLVATTVIEDSVVSTIHTTAAAATTAKFDLSSDVYARAVSDSVVAIEGAHGTLGHLVAARGSAASAAKLDLTATGDVVANLQAGQSVLFRAASEAQAGMNAELLAKAIAQGSLVAEVAAGLTGNVVTATSVDYASKVDTTILAEATKRGTLALDLTGMAATGGALAITADRAALRAVSADDILVKVNGEAATRVSTAAEVLASAQGSAEAKYFVATSLSGTTQVLTSIPALSLESATRVLVESKLEAESRAKAALDVFGSFKAGYGGAATGDIVSLVAKPEAGLLLDYTVAAKSTVEGAAATTTVFDAVQVGTSAFATASAASAHSLRFTSEDAVLEAYDVSSAIMKVTATAETTARFDVASGVKAEAVSEQVMMLKGQDFVGALILTKAEGGLASAGKLDLTATGEVVAKLQAGTQVVFKAFSGFESELTLDQKIAQAQAIARGDLLGQVIVDTDAATRTTQTASVNYYGGVEAVTSVASADKVEILVDSATHVGKSIIISLDRETVKGLINGDAELLIDGKVAQKAASYEDALTPNADKYWILTTDGEAGVQVLVSLAHFSTRSITLQTPEEPSIYLYTTIGLGIVVVGQALVPPIVRRLKNKE